MAPPATVHRALEMSPLGVEVIEQPVSPAAKLLPEMRTLVPGRPEAGSAEIAGSTVKSAVPKSVPGAPVTVTTVTPGTIAAITGNEPVTTPPEIVQDAPPPTAGPARAHVKSVGLKPVPDTDIDAPTGPEAGDRVTTRGTMF